MPDAFRIPRLLTALSVAAATLAAGACTTTRTPADPDDPMGEALSQPFRDLGLVQENAPVVVRKASADPYRASRDCAEINADIAELRSVLGPDVDEADADEDGAGVAGAIVSGATALPFRGLIREITGAKDREEEVAAAIIAAMVRRGFLKGERTALGCPSTAP
ncbi:MAG: hypothetical protein ACOY5Y_01955 [Pseudomonadota bacterium]